eukprot:PhF_6_TR38915/c0_g1_i1/m.58213
MFSNREFITFTLPICKLLRQSPPQHGLDPKLLHDCNTIIMALTNTFDAITSTSTLAHDTARTFLSLLGIHAQRLPSPIVLSDCIKASVPFGLELPFFNSFRSIALQRLIRVQSTTSPTESDMSALREVYIHGVLKIMWYCSHHGKESTVQLQEVKDSIEKALYSRHNELIQKYTRVCELGIFPTFDAEDWGSYNQFFKNRIVSHACASYILFMFDRLKEKSDVGVIVVRNTFSALCSRLLSTRYSSYRTSQLLLDVLFTVRCIRYLDPTDECKVIPSLLTLLLHSAVLTHPLPQLVSWIEHGCKNVLPSSTPLPAELWYPELSIPPVSGLDFFRKNGKYWVHSGGRIQKISHRLYTHT